MCFCFYFFAHLGDLEIDLQNDLQNDLKMVPPKSGKSTYLGRGGVPPEGVPWGRSFEVVLRSFWRSFCGRFGGRFEVVLEVVLRSF